MLLLSPVPMRRLHRLLSLRPVVLLPVNDCLGLISISVPLIRSFRHPHSFSLPDFHFSSAHPFPALVCLTTTSFSWHFFAQVAGGAWV